MLPREVVDDPAFFEAGRGVVIMRKLLSKELMSLGLKLDYKNKLY